MILVNFRFEFGWGDTLINTYNCIGLIKYIKQHTSLPVHFTIMSLFNFYPVSVKNVQITDIHKM